MGYNAYFGGDPTNGIDGVGLHNFFGILKVKRSILPARENFSKKIPSRFGEVYTGYTYAPKIIELECYITADDYVDHMTQLRMIADLLHVNSPQPLIISDEPDKYCYALPEGEFNVERIKTHGTFTLQFICHDPYTYSIEQTNVFADEKKIVTVDNRGTVETHPKISASFYKNSNFFQATNYTGETILIGSRTSEDKPNATGDTVVLSDPCETMTNWVATGNVVDSGREVMGSATINGGGYAIIGHDFGSSTNGWHGSAYRRNIGKNVQDFIFEITMEHNSKGDVKGTGASTTPPVTGGTSGDTTIPATKVKYKITADPSLRIRKERNTTSSILGSIPKNKVVEVSSISNNWGLVTYNNITGYISMQYVTLYKETTTSSNLGTYQATTDVNVRSKAANSGAVLTVAKKGVKSSVSEIKDGWLKVNVNGQTGWSYNKYWKKVTSTFSLENSLSRSTPSAENRLGRLEVYGFDVSGQKLFKCVLRDSEKWYEYTQPEVFIGNTLVLEDKKSCPTAPKVTEKDSDGKTVTKTVEGGKFGDWNEFYGKFRITRETNSKGQQVWKATVEKTKDGKVERSLTTSSLVNNSYPSGALNHIVVWFGQHKEDPVVDVMTLNHVKVTEKNKVTVDSNIPIFRAGDELLIDNEEQMVYLNSVPYMTYLDIGSEFFSSPTGESQFICASDDTTMDVFTDYQEKFI